MISWMGEAAGFGGEPDCERPEAVASFGGDSFVEVDMQVVDDFDQEADGWRTTTR